MEVVLSLHKYISSLALSFSSIHFFFIRLIRVISSSYARLISSSAMSVQGHLLDITVIGCRNLKDTEWLSRQDPYVILEYANNKFRTKTDTDGGRDPTFNEKYTLPLIEGLREINVNVWNSNTLRKDDFIGSGKILLQKVLAEGFHDSTWPLTTRSGRRAGEIRVILHYANPNGVHNATSYSGLTQHPAPVHAPTSMYPPSSHSHHTTQAYAAPSAYPPAYAPYSQPGYTYPPQSYPPQAYPPYPPQAYPPYPPQGYGAPPYPPY